MSASSQVGEVDTIIDVRSSKLEHWSYNLGMVQRVRALRQGASVNAILSNDASRLCNKIGVEVSGRSDVDFTSFRVINFLLRELYSLILILRYSRISKCMLIVHAHPLSLAISIVVLKMMKCKVIVSLHNDIIKSFRSNKSRDILERFLWMLLLNKVTGYSLAAPNKGFKRYLLKTGATSPIIVLPHPILQREDYEKIASSSPIVTCAYRMGFFGQVQDGRGLKRFLTFVDANQFSRFIIAGRNAHRITPRRNLSIYELPSIEDYSKLLLSTETMFIDLNSDWYRLGESGTYWDAVGLAMPFGIGDVPRLYRTRLMTSSKVSLDSLSSVGLDSPQNSIF
jgi:hypothetical protein